jgi:hypothetical protein
MCHQTPQINAMAFDRDGPPWRKAPRFKEPPLTQPCLAMYPHDAVAAIKAPPMQQPPPPRDIDAPLHKGPLPHKRPPQVPSPDMPPPAKAKAAPQCSPGNNVESTPQTTPTQHCTFANDLGRGVVGHAPISICCSVGALRQQLTSSMSDSVSALETRLRQEFTPHDEVNKQSDRILKLENALSDLKEALTVGMNDSVSAMETRLRQDVAAMNGKLDEEKRKVENLLLRVHVLEKKRKVENLLLRVDVLERLVMDIDNETNTQSNSTEGL